MSATSNEQLQALGDRIRRAPDEQELRRLDAELRHFERDEYRDGFRSWLRTGRTSTALGAAHSATVHFRDMGLGSSGGAYPSSASGFFAPLSIYDQIISSMKSYSGILDTATIIRTETGRVMGFPQDSDSTVEGELVQENEQVTQTDVPVAQTVLKSYLFSSRIIKLSLELLEDSSFDLESYLVEKFGVRIGRVMNRLFTVSQANPTGLLASASVGAVAIGASANTGGSDAGNSIGTSDLSALEASVDAAYRRPRGAFMMHANTLNSLRSVVTKTGVPAFLGLCQGGTDTINNYPVKVNNSFPVLQSGPSSPPTTINSVAFGNFSRFLIRLTTPVFYRLREKYADQGQVGFLMLCRADGTLIDTGGAVKLLTNTF